MNLLVDMNLVGSVVVARWYGGVLLGPVRFDHIVNVAKEAIKKWQDASNLVPEAKKVKTEQVSEMTPEQEAELKARLVKQLRDRDSSINVLRGLLAEKKAASTQKVEDNSVSQQAGSQGKAAAGPNYAAMPLKTLRQLEKAKDTTISWISETDR